MKKIAFVALTLVLAMSLLACGEAKPSTPAAPPTPPDLTGEWKQTDNASADTWQVAKIEGDTIEVYWVSDNGDTQALYWAGSFTAPTTPDEPYTWDSQNDTAKTDMAILASTDATKTFTYEAGVLSYQVSAMGATTTVKLEKQS